MNPKIDISEEKIKDLYKKSSEVVFESDGFLGEGLKADLIAVTEKIEEKIAELERLKLKLGGLLDYDDLKRGGKTAPDVLKIRAEDEEYLKKVEGFYQNNLDKHDYMFGYPANMEKDGYLLSYLRYLESKMYLMNNCGDPYERGNYGMDSKEVEREILQTFADSYGLKEGEYWGYVTTGGTESNFWGIREGFNKFPNARLYFSEKTHYSVEKFVYNNRVGSVYPYTIVKADSSGAISVEDLKLKIAKDREKSGYKPVILVLTWGTTKEGAIDDVKTITDYLIENGVEYYCHLDAALYGGIGKSQISAPVITDLKGLNVDSISVSLHKFLGAFRANGILISLTRDKRKVIDYIGQEDSTILGSRDFPPFSTLQRMKEFFTLKSPDHYIKNVNYFKELLVKNGVPYQTFDQEKCNIFVIDKPSDDVCKKYQLTTYDDYGTQKAHVIVFPFHKKEIMQELVQDLVKK